MSHLGCASARVRLERERVRASGARVRGRGDTVRGSVHRASCKLRLAGEQGAEGGLADGPRRRGSPTPVGPADDYVKSPLEILATALRPPLQVRVRELAKLHRSLAADVPVHGYS